MNHEHIALIQLELSSLTMDEKLANKIAFLFYKNQQRGTSIHHDCFDILVKGTLACQPADAIVGELGA